MAISIKKRYKVIAFIYVSIGLFVSMIGGLTQETLGKINTQIVKDKILEIENAYRDTDGLYICYLVKRDVNNILQNFIFISNYELEKNNGTYIKLKSRNIKAEYCKNDLNLKNIEIVNIEQNTFNKYFDFIIPKKLHNNESIYVVNKNNFIQNLGYIRSGIINGKNIILTISPPDIEKKGDLKQILFLPIAIVIDIISWPFSNVLNSSHM